MKNIPLEKITEKMEALAPELDEFLSSSSTASILSSVCSRYTLSSEEKFWVSRALGLYILRLYTAQDFVNELARVTPEKYLNQFRQELEDKLFSPYDAYMQQAGVVYKQLTKLEPKKDIEAGEPEPTPEQAIVLNVPLVSPLSTRPIQTEISQPEVIIVGDTRAREKTELPKPTLPAFIPPKEAARVKVSGGNLPSGLTPQAKEPTPIRPEIKEVKFEIPQTIAEITGEIIATAPGKDFQVPKPPEVPKTTVEGKEVVDLTDFSVKKN